MKNALQNALGIDILSVKSEKNSGGNGIMQQKSEK